MNADDTTITDARGLAVPLAAYGRVASLVPSLTDTVCSLGAGHKLVARTVYCCEPRDQVRSLPALGGTKNPDLPAILALKPDLALACVEENKPEHLTALAEAGVPVFAIMPRSLDDVAALLRDFGKLLDVGAAAGRALSDLAAARLAAGQFRASQSGSPRAATLIWKKPWMGAGAGTHINAVMTELGLVNVLARREDYYDVTLDELALKELDLVLLPDEPFPFTHHDSWSMAAAGVVPSRKQAVLLDGKLLSWYGTRTARSLRTLTKLLGALAPG